jgi:hypothetical protein
VQLREPRVGIVIGAFLPAVNRAEPGDTVLLIHPRYAAFRRQAQPVHQRARDGQDAFLAPGRGRGDPAQLAEPRVIKLTQIRVQPRQDDPEIRGQTADRGPRATAIRHGAGIVPTARCAATGPPAAGKLSGGLCPARSPGPAKADQPGLSA